MSTTRVEVAVSSGASLGECPLWNPDDGRLYWIDIEAKLVHRYDPSSGLDESRSLPGRPGSIGRTEAPGQFLMAMENEMVLFDWGEGTTNPWLVLEPADTGNRLNDGRTDPVGRFWVGSMYERTAEGRFTGMLHRIEATGDHETTRREIGVSNGLAFDPSRGRMYFADTLRDAIWRYDYDLKTGVAGGEELFIDFREHPGRPDGACVDADGCYWIAAVYGSAVLRFTPDGVLERTVQLPVEAPTMPAFGGADLTTLFVTSIGSGAGRPLASATVEPGALVAVDVGVAGVVDVPFGGSRS